MLVKTIAECSYWTSLSYHLSIRFLFCLFLSGHLRQELLYALSHTFNMHAARNLMLYLSLRLLQFFVYENSKGPGEAVQLRSIARAFAVSKCDKRQNPVCWLDVEITSTCSKSNLRDFRIQKSKTSWTLFLTLCKNGGNPWTGFDRT